MGSFGSEDLGVERIASTGMDSDEDMIGLETGQWKVDIAKWAVGFFDDEGFHTALL